MKTEDWSSRVTTRLHWSLGFPPIRFSLQSSAPPSISQPPLIDMHFLFCGRCSAFSLTLGPVPSAHMLHSKPQRLWLGCLVSLYIKVHIFMKGKMAIILMCCSFVCCFGLVVRCICYIRLVSEVVYGYSILYVIVKSPWLINVISGTWSWVWCNYRVNYCIHRYVCFM